MSLTSTVGNRVPRAIVNLVHCTALPEIGGDLRAQEVLRTRKRKYTVHVDRWTGETETCAAMMAVEKSDPGSKEQRADGR
jgi:hypothetical protein